MSRAGSMDRSPGWHWSEYWRGGRTEIMTIDSADGASVAFDPTAVWTPFFATLDPGARLLDLATGGGHVARLAHQAGLDRQAGFDVVGVDYADLGPSEGEVAPGLRLMGKVGLERLPFPEACFDAATSQYGIEYADTRLALGELARVLRPGGRARLLVHHAESAVSRSSAAQAAAHDKVMPDDAVIQKARKAYAAQLKRAAPDQARKAEDAFRQAVAQAAAKLEDDEAFGQARYHVDYLADLARGLARYAPHSALGLLDVFEAGVAAWRQRHRSQAKAALDQGGLDAFLQRAAAKGLEAAEAAPEQDARGALVAWRIDLRRA